MSNLAKFKAVLLLSMAARSSRNISLVDKLCRQILNRQLVRSAEDDFMRDPLIDNDTGFDPDELDRYQRGEIR